MNRELFVPDKLYNFLCLGAGDANHQEIAASYAGVDNLGLWQVAQENELESIIAHKFRDKVVADEIPEFWENAHEVNLARISEYMRELDRVAEALDRKGIPLVALKNSGIARGIYPCFGCCPMGDLDLLVERRHFREACSTIINDGYCLELRYSSRIQDLEAAESYGSAEFCKNLSAGLKLWLELQWRPVGGRWLSLKREPEGDDLIARSNEIRGTKARLLSPEDNLLSVCLHTAKHSYVRAPGLRLHLDVDRIVNRQLINWDIFLKQVLSLRVKTPVYFSLIIPKVLFDTPVPEDVLSRLKPPPWKEKVICNWLRRVNIFKPNEQKFGKIGYLIFMYLLYD